MKDVFFGMQVRKPAKQLHNTPADTTRLQAMKDSTYSANRSSMVISFCTML